MYFGISILVAWYRINFVASPLWGNGKIFKSFIPKIQKYSGSMTTIARSSKSMPFSMKYVQFRSIALCQGFLEDTRFSGTLNIFFPELIREKYRELRLVPMCWCRREHWLIFEAGNMNYFGHYLSLPEIQIWFWLCICKVAMHCIFCGASRKENHNGFLINPTFCQNVFGKNNLVKNYERIIRYSMPAKTALTYIGRKSCTRFLSKSLMLLISGWKRAGKKDTQEYV